MGQICALIAGRGVYKSGPLQILSKLKQKYEAEGNKKGLAVLKKISPVAWRHIHFQGHLIFSGDKVIDIDSIIDKVLLNGLIRDSVPNDCPDSHNRLAAIITLI